MKLDVTRGDPLDGNVSSHLVYSTVTGFFLQDEPRTDDIGFDFAAPFEGNATCFGLIVRKYDTDAEFDPDHSKTQWERFQHYVESLNRKEIGRVQYKLLYLGRHGQGYHNVGEEKYGTPDWDCYWSMLPEYTDAVLTLTGIKQAERVRDFWNNALVHFKVPAPQLYLSSPLTRCLQTAETSFRSLNLPSDLQFDPLVKELVRERLGIHTCDKRSPRSWIEQNYPAFRIESGFSEEDELWDAKLRETASGQTARLMPFLDELFLDKIDAKDAHHEKPTFVSITCHSGTIGGIIDAVKHRPFSVQTGGVVPILVRAEQVIGVRPPMNVDPPMPAPSCDKTFVAGTG